MPRYQMRFPTPEAADQAATAIDFCTRWHPAIRGLYVSWTSSWDKFRVGRELLRVSPRLKLADLEIVTPKTGEG